MAILQSANLFYQEGRSDKEYHLQLVQEGSTYSVTFQYGRRGSALNEGTKISGVTREVAQKTYNKILNEKLGKGYQEQNGPHQAFVPAPAVQTQPFTPQFVEPAGRKVNWQPPKEIIFIPQLLNVIEEKDIETYLRDDRYIGQEKKDGRHQPFHKKSGTVTVTNKKGQAIGYPAALKDAIRTDKDLLVDAEIIGDTFHAFDLLEYDGEDLRAFPYNDRYQILKSLFDRKEFDTQHIRLVPIAVWYKAKKAMYDKLKREKREGMVFKLLDAPYTPGKAHAAMWKCKFYAELSARVCKGREGKRSVGVELIENVELLGKTVRAWKFMGNVTIPPDKAVPEMGQIVEIRYLYVDGPGGALYQPFYKEPRDDVDPSECLMSQVKYKPQED